MTPKVRKAALTAHVLSSVGWAGSVAAFLALAVTGLTTEARETSRAAYVSMATITWSVIVPLNVAALASGLLQGWGTPWGLVRHYWVLGKLLLTTAATIILLLHTQVIGYMATAASHAMPQGADIDRLRLQLVVNAAAALIVLFLTTLVAVVKPAGRTPFGPVAAR